MTLSHIQVQRPRNVCTVHSVEVVHLSMFNNVVLLKKRDLAQTQAMSDEVADCSMASLSPTDMNSPDID